MITALFPNCRIRDGRLEDLITLAEIEQAAATLFCDTPYAFLVNAEPLPLEALLNQGMNCPRAAGNPRFKVPHFWGI
ncbi:hypothetical protein ACKFKG_10445 [Phormidesmis sp. 146-35]